MAGSALREQQGHTILNAWFKPENSNRATLSSEAWRGLPPKALAKAGSLTSAYRVEKNTTLVI
jgi:hypothetical protein